MMKRWLVSIGVGFLGLVFLQAALAEVPLIRFEVKNHFMVGMSVVCTHHGDEWFRNFHAYFPPKMRTYQELGTAHSGLTSPYGAWVCEAIYDEDPAGPHGGCTGDDVGCPKVSFKVIEPIGGGLVVVKLLIKGKGDHAELTHQID